MMMKRIHSGLPTIVGIALLVLAGCVPSFNTAYERIDIGKTRLLSMQFVPPEAAPGDTVLAVCVFAGEPVTPSDIEWNVSNKVLVNDYGSDTALEIHSLAADGMIPVDTTFSPSTYTVAFKFTIPKDFLYRSPSIPDDWKGLLGSGASSVPPELARLTKEDILSSLDSLAAVPPLRELRADPLDIIKVAVAAQLFSAKMRLFGNVRGGALNIVRNCTIRYANSIARIPGLPLYVNHNPTLDSARILKVNGAGLSSFIPGVNSQSYEPIKIFDAFHPSADTTTVLIDKNYSYFVQGFGAGADSLNLLSTAFGGAQVSADSVREQLGYQWYFQVDSTASHGVSPTDYPQFSAFSFLGGSISAFTPAVDSRVTAVRWWVQVYDQITIKEISRPSGCSLYEMKCRFEYTQAYLDAAKKGK